MFCSKCGTKMAEGQKFCSSCGTSVTDKSGANNVPVVVVKERGGCFKGCLIAAVFWMIALFVGLVAVVAIVDSSTSSEEEEAIAASSAITAEEATKNGEDLIAWIRSKEGMTDLMRDDAFAKLKGKTVMLRGKVREIGKAAFSEEVFVSLTVGRLGALENLNVQFNVRESQTERIKTWNKDEVHTLRGRIKGQGDLIDDAECDIAEIVE